MKRMANIMMMVVMPLVITMVMLVEKEGRVVSKAGAYLASCPLLTNDNTTHSIVIILAIIIIIIAVGMVRVIGKATNSRTKLKSKNFAMCRNISHSTCTHHRMMTAKSLQS